MSIHCRGRQAGRFNSERLCHRHVSPLGARAVLLDPDAPGIVGCGIYDLKTAAEFG